MYERIVFSDLLGIVNTIQVLLLLCKLLQCTPVFSCSCRRPPRALQVRPHKVIQSKYACESLDIRSLGQRMTPLVTVGHKDLSGSHGQTVSTAADLMGAFKRCEDVSGFCFRWTANKANMSRMSLGESEQTVERDSGWTWGACLVSPDSGWVRELCSSLSSPELRMDGLPKHKK